MTYDMAAKQLKHRLIMSVAPIEDFPHLELIGVDTQCKSHVGQLRSMLWIRYWNAWWHHVGIANSFHLNSSMTLLITVEWQLSRQRCSKRNK